jgi:hypothetical protein
VFKGACQHVLRLGILHHSQSRVVLASSILIVAWLAQGLLYLFSISSRLKNDCPVLCDIDRKNVTHCHWLRPPCMQARGGAALSLSRRCSLKTCCLALCDTCAL